MTRKVLIAGIVAAAAGFAGGWGAAVYAPWGESPVKQAKHADGRRILYWVAPMDPSFRRDRPGKSPMGMDLVPVYEDQETADPGIAIEPQVVNNLGVKTATAERGVIRVPINTVGRIEFDEERLAHIHLRSSGWIQRLVVRAEGEPVKRGDPLFEVYSPELVKAQAEFLQALKGGRTGLIDATRERLRALDISASRIAAIERTREVDQYVRFYAPISGVVSSLNVADGKFVNPGTDIMVIADLSQVWLISDVFESQADQIAIGARLTARSKFDPGASIESTVDYVYPDLDPVTRTVPVRSRLANADGQLKPGMFMTVRIEGRERPPATLIPSEALIRTGQSERVILALGDGRFRPAAVTSGVEAGGRVEVLTGLAPGESVVVSGQFLIDSESSYAGAALRLSGGRPSTQTDQGQTKHGGTEHDAMPSGELESPP